MEDNNINKQYKDLIFNILENGYIYTDKSRNVQCKQISSHTLNIDLQQGFPAINLKKLYWKGVVGELIWFLRGDTNIKYLVDNNINIWNKDAYNWYLKNSDKNSDGHNNTLKEYVNYIKNTNILYNEEMFISKKGDLGRVYGAQWRKWLGNSINFGFGDTPHSANYVDQISNLIKNLKEQPMSRRHIVTAWNPSELNDMALPPCHWSFEILVEPTKDTQNNTSYSGGIIDFSKNPGKSYTETWRKPKYQFTLKWHQRSVDTFLGQM